MSEPSSTTKSSAYVVYVYVDYRKETGARLMRSYTNRKKAIAFAESLSTKYVKEPKAKKQKTESIMATNTGGSIVEESEGKKEDNGTGVEVVEEQDEENEYDDEEEDWIGEDPEYVSMIGTEFDARLKLPKNKLVDYGVSLTDVSALWYVRIAVDKVDQW